MFHLLGTTLRFVMFCCLLIETKCTLQLTTWSLFLAFCHYSGYYDICPRTYTYAPKDTTYMHTYTDQITLSFFCVVLLEEVVLVNLFLASTSKFLLVNAVLDAQFHVKGDDGISHILINFNCF